LKKQKSMKSSIRQRNRVWTLMCLGPMLFLLLMKYLPMIGIVIAFKEYRFDQGIFGSRWVGLDNFSTFLRSRELGLLFRNTIGYNLLIVYGSLVASTCVALLLYEVKSRKATKVYQTVMITPRFVSIIIVGYLTYSFLNPSSGIANRFLMKIGLEPVPWYSIKWIWPFFLPLVSIWKGIGMSSVIKYAALMGVDSSLIEAAEIDGATKIQKYFHVLIPSIFPALSVLLILNLGGILDGDFGLFYYIPRNVGALRTVTEIFPTYTMRLFKGQDVGVNYSLSSAVNLFQSVAGMILVLSADRLIKFIDKDLGIF